MLSDNLPSIEDLLSGKGSQGVNPSGSVSVEDLLTQHDAKSKPAEPTQPVDNFVEDKLEYYMGVPVSVGKVSTNVEWGPVVHDQPPPAHSKDTGSYLTAGELKPDFIQSAMNSLAGVLGIDINNLSEQARADATVQVMAKQRGINLSDYRSSPELIEHAASSFVSSFTGGLAPAIREALTGETDFPATSTAGHIGSGLGSVAGFAAGLPINIAGKAFGVGRTMEGLRRTPWIRSLPEAFKNMPFKERILKAAITDAVVLGTASGIAETGEALKSQTFTEASGKILKGMFSGAVTGAIFGMAKGLFPADGWQTGARLTTGLIGLNAQRAVTGGNPFTDRPIGDVVFDVGLDALFLYHGLPKGRFARITKKVNDVAAKGAEIQQKQELVQQIPEQAVRIAQEKVIEVEKQQNELAKQAAADEIKEAVDTSANNKEVTKKVRAKRKTVSGAVKTEQANIDEITNVEQQKTFGAPRPLAEQPAPGTLAAPTPEKPLPGIEQPTQTQPTKPAYKDLFNEAGDIVELTTTDLMKTLNESVKGEETKVNKNILPTTEPSPEVTGAQIDALEKHYGKDISDITHEEVNSFINDKSAKPDVVKDTAQAEDVTGKTEEQILEDHYGKPIDKITDKEIDAFYSLDPADSVNEPEQQTEVDVQTGTPEIKYESVFDADKETTQARTENYNRIKSVAGSVSELFNQDPASSTKAPDSTTWKLVNDINRWVHGEDINIDSARNFLSELAGRASEFRYHFVGPDYPQSFEDWKDAVSEAAEWARKKERPSTESSGVRSIYDGSTMNMFIDPTRAPEVIRKIFNDLKETLGKNKLSAEEIWKKTGLFLNPYDNRWRFEIDDSKLELITEIGDKGGKTVLDKISAHISGTRRLEDVIDYPQLFEAYPEFKGINIARYRDHLGELSSVEGWANQATNTINISPYTKDPRSILAHELQHMIQFKSGFAVGGNQDTAIDSAGPEALVGLKDITIRVLTQELERHNKAIESIDDGVRLLHSIPESERSTIEDLAHKFDKLQKEERVLFARHKIINPTLNFYSTEEGKAFAGKKSDIIETIKGVVGTDTKGAIKIIFGIGDSTIDKKLVEVTETRLVRTQQVKEVSSLISVINDTKDTNTLRSRIKEAGEANYDAYRALAGEIEARDVQGRLGLSEYGRADKLPLSTENWKKEDVIVHYKSGPSLNESAKQVAKQVPKLYSGFPIDDAAKFVIDAAKKASKYFDDQQKARELDVSKIGKPLKEELNRAFVDRSANIREDLLNKAGNQGYDVVQRMSLARGAGARATNMLRQMRKEVYSGFSKDERRILDKVILNNTVIDLGKHSTSDKFPEGLTPINSTAYVNLFEQLEGLTPQRASDIKNASRGFYEHIKKAIDDMKSEGLLDQKSYDSLINRSFNIGTPDNPTTFADLIDRKTVTKEGDIKKQAYDSGTKKLARGKNADIYEPNSEIVALEVFNRAYGRIANNQANKSLLELARDDRDNSFVRVRESKTDPPIPPDYARNKINVYENGERISLYLSPDMAKEWLNVDSDISPRLAKAIRYISLAPITRTMATGVEWGFALANLPRDMAQIWWATRTFEDGKWKAAYSPEPISYSFQMGSDLARTFSDALLRKGRFNDYINEGGGMDFLVHQARPFREGLHLESGIDKIYNVMGYLGETTEMMTRLAVRDRVIRNRAKQKGISFEEASKDKKITTEATFAARDYMDFATGGWATKAADQGLPYLNAAVVAGRSFFRSFKPGSGTAAVSSLKLAQFATAVTGLYLASMYMAPKTHKALKDDVVTQNNMIVPLGDHFGFEDEHGQMRYIYLKAPLDQNLRFFKKFFEASTDKWQGNDIDAAGTTNALGQISPVGISSMPPTAAGALGYATNIDFWRNEKIWNKTDQPLSYPNSKEEYTPGKTPQLAIDAGKLTGLSPERLRYVTRQLVANSMWGQMVGGAYEKMFGSALSSNQKQQHLAQVLASTPGVSRFFGLTNPYSQFAKSIDTNKEESMKKNWIQERGLDAVVEGYLFNKTAKYEDVMNYIDSFEDRNDREKMKDRFKFQEKIKDLPNRSFWLRLKGLDTEARARVYNERLSKSDSSEREQLYNEEDIIKRAGGVITPEFRRELRNLIQ